MEIIIKVPSLTIKDFEGDTLTLVISGSITWIDVRFSNKSDRKELRKFAKFILKNTKEIN